MKFLAKVCIVVALAVIPTFAQEPVQIEFAAYAGRPLNHTLESQFCCTTAVNFFRYLPEDARYIAGVSVGVVPYDRIHIAFGALYMPVSFRVQGTTCCPIANPTTTEHGTSWEFPLLADYRWLSGALRPFSGGGLVIANNISGGKDQAPAPVVSGGVEWLRGSFVIRPEFRYSHYPYYRSSTATVGRPSTQLQLLIGIAYRIKGAK